MKSCIFCKIEKAKEEFGKHKRSGDRLRDECKKCSVNQNRIWRFNNYYKTKTKTCRDTDRKKTYAIKKILLIETIVIF